MNNSTTWYWFLFVGLFFNHKAFLRKGTKRRGKEIKNQSLTCKEFIVHVKKQGVYTQKDQQL